MHEFSLDYLACPRCNSALELNSFCAQTEIDEGFLECHVCNLSFPIINKIPIIWDNFSKYLSVRTILGKNLFQMASHEKIKNFIKTSMSYGKTNLDRTSLEEKWTNIYRDSKRSKFYTIIKNKIARISKTSLALEYGCSIGLITKSLAKHHEIVFGIDQSYSAISFAKKSKTENLDYFVADTLSPIFGNTKFDLVIALNLLDIVEPDKLLRHVSGQISKGFFMLSTPYDFERGINSVRYPLDAVSLRAKLNDLGFSVYAGTKNPSYHNWNLKINSRCTLNYRVDFVMAKK